MRYRISEVKLNAKEYADREHLMELLQQALEQKLLAKFGKKLSGRRRPGTPQASKIEIIRESVDARRKPDVKAVFTLDFESPLKLPLPEGAPEGYNSGVFASEHPAADEADRPAKAGAHSMEMTGNDRPVVVGFGPCGIFAALLLAEAGLRPVVLERGRPVDQRVRDVKRFWDEGILDPESNVQFGEGGAGTFSDGKLTTGIRDSRIRKVLTEFVAAGADPAILYQQRPHIGTDRLRQIIPRIRRRIEALGGEVRFRTKLVGLETANGQLSAVRIVAGSGDPAGSEERIAATDLILAIGHSARDTFRMLRDTGLAMEQKPFSIGVRIEHPQKKIDAAQYGDPALAEVFGPAAYRLHHRCRNGRGVYTFCMCPGGTVINASSEAHGAVTNGMSESGRDSGVANSGLLVDVRTDDFDSDDPLAGVEFQRRYEALAREEGLRQQAQTSGAKRDGAEADLPPCGGGGLPRSAYGRFREDPADPVRRCLPVFAAEAMLEAMPHLGQKLRGFDDPDAVMTAVETRSSSPVRILRDEEMQSAIRGVIPAGEGPGYAGGIMSAAVDGIKAAERIVRKSNRK